MPQQQHCFIYPPENTCYWSGKTLGRFIPFFLLGNIVALLSFQTVPVEYDQVSYLRKDLISKSNGDRTDRLNSHRENTETKCGWVKGFRVFRAVEASHEDTFKTVINREGAQKEEQLPSSLSWAEHSANSRYPLIILTTATMIRDIHEVNPDVRVVTHLSEC